MAAQSVCRLIGANLKKVQTHVFQRSVESRAWSGAEVGGLIRIPEFFSSLSVQRIFLLLAGEIIINLHKGKQHRWRVAWQASLTSRYQRRQIIPSDDHLDHSLQQLKAIVSGITNINTRSISAAIESELWCLLCCYGEIILYPGRIVRLKTRLENILEAILMRVFFWQNMLDMLHWIYCELNIDRRGSRFFHNAMLSS